MNNFKKELEQKISNQSVSLPESLSAENIEELINKEGSIIQPKLVSKNKGATVLKWCSGIAAVFVVLFAVISLVDVSSQSIAKKRQDSYIRSIVTKDSLAKNDYSKIELAVLKYYQELYNKQQGSIKDTILDGIGDFAGGFATKDESANMSAESADSATGTTGTASTSSHATTNTQVDGVDEADVIKNDGKHIYYLTRSSIVITDCSNPSEMKTVATISFEENTKTPAEMFVYDNKLVVISTKYTLYESYASPTGVAIDDSADSITFSTCYAPESATIIEIYDLTDITAPKSVYSVELDGTYLSSRITDGKLLVVTNYYLPYYNLAGYDFNEACDEIKANCIPTYSVNGSERVRVDADRINLLSEESPTEYVVTSLLTLDEMNFTSALDSILGGGYEVYCTQNNLYVAASNYDDLLKAADGREYFSATTIYKFTIGQSGITYKAQNTAGGIMINQLAMDESSGILRVATQGALKDDNWLNESMVFTFSENMEYLGSIGGIAKGETMRSARFLGNTLYFVTFLQTDPLFAIDLTDAKNPQIMGELKIPGFSTYLHPVGDSLLIGTGADGTQTGTNGYGKISLFDVSDTANLKELDNYSTYEQGNFISNHKAFVVIDENTFMLPFLSYEYESELIVFSVENGAIKVEERINFISDYYDESARGTFIENTVFAVNKNGIVAYDIENNVQLGIIEF